MQTKRSIPLLLLPGLLACGCATMTPTERGVGAGGLIGAGTGALIGNATGHTGAGAVIGAGVGALTGGLVGNSIEQSEKKTQAQIAAAQAQATQASQLGVTDVVQMAQQHVSDDVIISQIRSTGSVFRLSSNDTIWLKQQGVSDMVVQEMLSTANRPPRQVYSAAPVYYSRPVYVVEPAPPPPVAFGFGYSYHRFR